MLLLHMSVLRQNLELGSFLGHFFGIPHNFPETLCTNTFFPLDFSLFFPLAKPHSFKHVGELFFFLYSIMDCKSQGPLALPGLHYQPTRLSSPAFPWIGSMFCNGLVCSWDLAGGPGHPPTSSWALHPPCPLSSPCSLPGSSWPFCCSSHSRLGHFPQPPSFRPEAQFTPNAPHFFALSQQAFPCLWGA